MVCSNCKQYLEKTNPTPLEDVLDQVHGDLETEDYLGGQAYLEDDKSEESKMESEDEELVAIELNKCYEALEQTPIKHKSKITPTYIKEKVTRVTSALKRKFGPLSSAGSISESSDDESNTAKINAEKAEKFDSLMNDLKGEFKKGATKSEKSMVKVKTEILSSYPGEEQDLKMEIKRENGKLQTLFTLNFISW